MTTSTLPPALLTVAGIRFTDDLARMRAFLEALGLSAGITRGLDWAAMHAEAGMVLLHSAATSDRGAAAGVTLLTGESDDVKMLGEQLGRHGFASTVIDEAYGRALEVGDPLGAVVTINETQRDSYGYQAQRPEPEAGIEVVLSRFTDPAGPYAGFCEALGLHSVGDWGEGYADFGSRIETTDPDGQHVEIHHR